MRSPALAIAWEFRQRHRFALIAFFSYFTILGVVRVLFLGPDSLTLDRPSGVAAAVVVPLTTTAMYLLAVFSYGLGGDMAARPSIYPARMFTLPVTTAALAGWPMLLGTAAIASLWLSAVFLARWSWGIVLPLIWPALLGAVFLAWTQVLTWNAYGLPGLRIVVTVLWLSSLGAAGPFAVEYKVSESRLVAILAPQLPLAYLAAWLVLRRARRGEVPDWSGVFARTSRVADQLWPRSKQFRSPERAQLWFEWRREGWILPLAVGLVLPFELGLLYLASDEPAFLVFATLLAVLLTPPFMAGFAGAIAGRSGRDGSGSPGATFTATRPLTSAGLVAAKLEMALWSTLLAWLLVLVAVPLALTLTDTWPVVVERIGRAIEVVGKPRATVLALLAVVGLLASTWKQLVQSLCVQLTGRAWVVRTNVLVRLWFPIVLIPIGDWIYENPRGAFVVLWDAWPWILGTLVCLKMSVAAWVLPRLHRSRLLGDRALVALAATWLSVVLALYGVLVWLVCTPPLLPRYLPALVAIMAVPLARLSAAPLALASNRHRGVEGVSRLSAAPSRGRTLGVVRALIGLPVALLVFEMVSYAVVNRSNATIVSSGEEREYLLYVPRTYDPAKPTPLVISMHGGALWPVAQRGISQWNRVADSQGFLVVYPSARVGRGPRAWVMSPRSIERNVRFISDLIDALKASYNIDSTRVYADGLSNGGGMAFVLSCALSDRIAAVGLVASAQLLPFDWCADERAVPMIAIHGTADRLTPYHGGTSLAAPRPLPDIPTWTADWARRNRCGLDPVEAAVAADVTRLEYTGCADDAAVVLYTVKGGGHTWPGGGPAPEWFVGPTNRSIEASSLMWAFFRDHRLPTTRRQ